MNIKIDLEDFFTDDRKHSLLFIDFDGKKLVSDVIDYICEVFDIDTKVFFRESLYFLSNGIYIPEKQPSLVLKEVLNKLSLKRRCTTVRTTAFSYECTSEKVDELDRSNNQVEKKSDDENIPLCKELNFQIYSNDNSPDFADQNPAKSKKKKKHRPKDNYDLYNKDKINSFPDSECSSSQPICLKEKSKKNKQKHLSKVIDANEKEIHSTGALNKENGEEIGSSVIDFRIRGNSKDNELYEQSETFLGSMLSNGVSNVEPVFQTTSEDCHRKHKKRKKLKDEKKVHEPLEILSQGDFICPVKKKSKSTSHSPLIHSQKLPVDLNCNKEEDLIQKESQENSIYGKNPDENPLVKEVLVESDINSLNFSLKANLPKRKRKRKHKKKTKNCLFDDSFNSHNCAIAEVNSEARPKIFKRPKADLSNSEIKNSHLKFDSDEEKSRFSNCISTVARSLANNIVDDSAAGTDIKLNYQSSTNASLYCNNEPIGFVTHVVTVLDSLLPSSLQNCGKSPPTTIERDEVENIVDLDRFASLLKLESSKTVSVFARRRPIKEPSSILLNLSEVSSQMPSLPQDRPSPPSPETSSIKPENELDSALHQYQKLENSMFPHTFYRKRLISPASENSNGSLNIAKEQSILELPISFTSGRYKNQKKQIKDSPSMTEEIFFEANHNFERSKTNNVSISSNGNNYDHEKKQTIVPQINNTSIVSNMVNYDYEKEENMVPKTNNTTIFSNFANYDNTNEENVASFMGVRPKKIKEKKMYASIGNVINSLKLSQQTIIESSERKTANLNDSPMEVDSAEAYYNDEVNSEERKISCRGQIIKEEVIDSLEDSNTLTGENILSLESFTLKKNSVASNNDHPGSPQTTEVKESNDLKNFYQLCPLLPSLPNVGDIIAAKVMTLDETYSPYYSDYRPAKVNSISGLTLSLSFLDYSEISPDEIRRGSIHPSFKHKEVLKIDWRDLKDVRLLFP